MAGKTKGRAPARQTRVGSVTKATLQKGRDRIFRALIENASDIITILSSEGTIEYESPAIKRILGYEPEELNGRSSFELVHPEDIEGVQAAFLEVISNKWTGQGIEFRFRHKDGSWRFLELTGTNLLQDAAVEGIVVNSRDVTERKKSEQSLRESEERYALAVRGANDGLWDLELRTQRLYLSPRWKSMLGYGESEIADSMDEWLVRVHPEDRRHLELAMSAHLGGHTPHFECEYRIRHKDGEFRYILVRGVAVRDHNGQAYRMAGSQSDITDRKRAEERLIHDAFHDSLTGLPNRALFLDRLRGSLSRARRRKNYCFAVLFLDLDRFKIVNDSLGHISGDHLLVEIGRVLEKCVRPEDTVARLGGDEFIILIDDIEERSVASSVARRIQDHLSLPFNIDGHDIFTSVSIGIAFNSPEYERPEDFIRDSDTAMYHAKSLGKARFELFDSSMRTHAMKMLEIETELRRAIERNEIEVWYQPIMQIQNSRLDGFEALARWRSPKRGLVSPAEFIPVAEETGLIIPIGTIVLETACRQLREWMNDFSARHVSMSVNLSTRQFIQPDLVEQVRRILERFNVPTEQLKLEITESALMGDMSAAEEILKRLRKLGIKVCLDDFGTGYSSLNYLTRLPIDTLKIDKTFVDGIGVEAESSEVINTIIQLARHLKLNVVAEGVETTNQLKQLSALNCDQAQGYLFSRPVESKAATELLSVHV